MFSHLKLCLATAKHNLKWLKIYVFYNLGNLSPNIYQCFKIESIFSVTWSCVSLPRYTTSSDWKCMLLLTFKSQYISLFQDWRHILLWTALYQVLIKHRITTAVDLGALRVDPCYSAMQSVRIVTSIFSSRRHRRWDGGSYGFYLRFFCLFFCL